MRSLFFDRIDGKTGNTGENTGDDNTEVRYLLLLLCCIRFRGDDGGGSGADADDR